MLPLFEYDEAEGVLKFLGKYVFDHVTVDRTVIEKIEAVNDLIASANYFCNRVDAGAVKSKATYKDLNDALVTLGVRK